MYKGELEEVYINIKDGIFKRVRNNRIIVYK